MKKELTAGEALDYLLTDIYNKCVKDSDGYEWDFPGAANDMDAFIDKPPYTIPDEKIELTWGQIEAALSPFIDAEVDLLGRDWTLGPKKQLGFNIGDK